MDKKELKKLKELLVGLHNSALNDKSVMLQLKEICIKTDNLELASIYNYHLKREVIR